MLEYSLQNLLRQPYGTCGLHCLFCFLINSLMAAKRRKGRGKGQSRSAEQSSSSLRGTGQSQRKGTVSIPIPHRIPHRNPEFPNLGTQNGSVKRDMNVGIPAQKANCETWAGKLTEFLRIFRPSRGQFDLSGGSGDLVRTDPQWRNRRAAIRGGYAGEAT